MYETSDPSVCVGGIARSLSGDASRLSFPVAWWHWSRSAPWSPVDSLTVPTLLCWALHLLQAPVLRTAAILCFSDSVRARLCFLSFKSMSKTCVGTELPSPLELGGNLRSESEPLESSSKIVRRNFPDGSILLNLSSWYVCGRVLGLSTLVC